LSRFSRALIDSSFVRAAYGGEETGPSPVDRSKPGSKHHVITDADGIPLAGSVTAANRNDVGALRLRTIATKDQPCADSPFRSADDYDPAVILDLDYWVLMPK
jgi:hypothetical protein